MSLLDGFPAATQFEWKRLLPFTRGNGTACIRRRETYAALVAHLHDRDGLAVMTIVPVRGITQAGPGILLDAQVRAGLDIHLARIG
jgi:hypothetical protein